MRRRTFIALLGGAAAWPLVARAQQPVHKRRIALLMGGSDDGGYRPRLAAFRQALEQLGWSEGRNLDIEVRWGANDPERIAMLAREVVSLQPEVILAGPSHVLIPLKNATRSIPIVFVNVSDPIAQGIVESLARPSGNVTGFTNLEFSLLGKWLQMLKEIAPGIGRVAVMIFTGNAASANWYRMLDTVAPTLALEPIAAPIRERADIEPVMTALARAPNGGLVVPGDTLVVNPDARRLIIGLASRHRIPTMYGRPEFVPEGGLIAYGIDPTDPYRRAASYVDRILKGEQPADLPVQQPTRFELAINLQTAKALGLDVPPTLLARADEVIE